MGDAEVIVPEALEYLRALSNDSIADEMAETYIDVGPAPVRWLDERGPAMVFGYLAGRDIAQRAAAKTPPALAASHGGA